MAHKGRIADKYSLIYAVLFRHTYPMVLINYLEYLVFCNRIWGQREVLVLNLARHIYFKSLTWVERNISRLFSIYFALMPLGSPHTIYYVRLGGVKTALFQLKN